MPLAPIEKFRGRTPPTELSVDAAAEGVRAGDRAILSRAITRTESAHPAHYRFAQELLTRLLPETGNAYRVGITGTPGVGKSTTIEALGLMLCERGHKVAVLAVDPTSSRTGGSILGDKTRMERLSRHAGAFIRPSPTSGNLGGVNKTTRESMILCDAAGYDVILVETVGVGQSETMVADMVDFFLLLMVAGGGDELQGIKRGILELADAIAVNKADGDNVKRAQAAARELAMAMHIMPPQSPNWSPPVSTYSAATGKGLAEIWDTVEKHRATMSNSGELAQKRIGQQLRWTWSMVENRLKTALLENPDVARLIPIIEADLRAGRMTAAIAADTLLKAFSDRI